MNKAAKTIQYFKSRREGFDRLFSLFLKKYERYGGDVNAKVTLRDPLQTEIECLSSFIGKDYRRCGSISVTFRKIEGILVDREFAITDIKTLLEQYYNKPQLTRKELEHKKHLRYQHFLEKAKSLSGHPYFRWYMESIEEKSVGYRRFIKMFKENSSGLLESLQFIAAAVEFMPLERNMRLPYFSTKATGNPHAFDTNKELGKLLLEVLKIAFLKEEKQLFEYQTKAEQVQDLLLSFGILKDDITNSVGFCGLQIFNECGAESMIYKEGYSIGKVHLEPLREVSKFASVKSYWNTRYVFVIEGSGIFSTIVDEVQERIGHVPPMICTFGQFRVAAIKLIEHLVKSGYTILYSGDHDPDGVLMAQLLCNRFGDVVVPWGYSERYYQTTTSKEFISDSDMASLNGVHHNGLREVKRLLETTKIACYQEDFTNYLVGDILRQG